MAALGDTSYSCRVHGNELAAPDISHNRTGRGPVLMAHVRAPGIALSRGARGSRAGGGRRGGSPLGEGGLVPALRGW